MNKQSSYRTGYITILGRPNVGKSTLLNGLLGRKLSITSRKPQTTRNKILGIKTNAEHQMIYLDTPGIHSQKNRKNKLNAQMNKTALRSIQDVDVILFVVSGVNWTIEDDLILQKLQAAPSPIILVINKIDLIFPKERILDHINNIKNKHPFAAIIPLAAKRPSTLDPLETLIKQYLPLGPQLFSSALHTDRDDKFLLAELLREKLIRYLGDELPYSLFITIDHSADDGKNIQKIIATIHVEKQGQKKIIIGENGKVLKKLGTLARKDMEKYLNKKVFLQLWVKIKNNWTKNEKILASLGYEI